jgi:hypothetical protein
MTIAEWNALAALLDHLWPGDFTTEDSSAYHLVLGSSPAHPVRDAIRELAASDEWRPTPAKILKRAGLNAKSQRRHAWRQHFSALEHTYGRDQAIAQLDPLGDLEAHYPPELPAGTTYHTRHARREQLTQGNR